MWDETTLGDDVLKMRTNDIIQLTRMIDNEIRMMAAELNMLANDNEIQRIKIRENNEKIRKNAVVPYLVSNIVEILEVDMDDEDKDGSAKLIDTQPKGKSAVIKTSARQTIFLPAIGLVSAETLTPGDLVGVNKDSFVILDTIAQEYDSRVMAMEVDERPTEKYSDIGGLDKQIQELVEAVVLPITQKEKFINMGIHPPKGCLMYGPPGTGKTLLARVS